MYEKMPKDERNKGVQLGQEGTTMTVRVENDHSGQKQDAERRLSDTLDTTPVTIMQTTSLKGKRKGREKKREREENSLP